MSLHVYIDDIEVIPWSTMTELFRKTIQDDGCHLEIDPNNELRYYEYGMFADDLRRIMNSIDFSKAAPDDSTIVEHALEIKKDFLKALAGYSGDDLVVFQIL